MMRKKHYPNTTILNKRMSIANNWKFKLCIEILIIYYKSDYYYYHNYYWMNDKLQAANELIEMHSDQCGFTVVSTW